MRLHHFQNYKNIHLKDLVYLLTDRLGVIEATIICVSNLLSELSKSHDVINRVKKDAVAR